MRELWWLFRGSLRLRLTGADTARSLRMLSRQMRLEDVCRRSHLEVEFAIASSDRKKAEAVAERCGDRLEILEYRGFPQTVEKWLRYPLICLTILVLICVSLWLPSRVLFFRVEGSETIPERRILESAAECGLSFGAARGQVRSEQIKNRLLSALPELSWVGVNTSGCTATITVQERQREQRPEQPLPGNIVASIDGIVTSVNVTEGSPRCAIGEGVRAGQTLISGYTDLGLCTHVEAAQGEVFALTERSVSAVLPRMTVVSGAEGENVKKYSLLLGKIRINFYSDSGILHTGCGKMTQIRVLTLPGGFCLPAALIVEEYVVSERISAERSPEEAEKTMEAAARAALEHTMIAGQIRSAECAFREEDELYRLRLLCRCHEMIGRRSSGIITEGDANDGENDKRGAG